MSNLFKKRASEQQGFISINTVLTSRVSLFGSGVFYTLVSTLSFFLYLKKNPKTNSNSNTSPDPHLNLNPHYDPDPNPNSNPSLRYHKLPYSNPGVCPRSRLGRLLYLPNTNLDLKIYKRRKITSKIYLTR